MDRPSATSAGHHRETPPGRTSTGPEPAPASSPEPVQRWRIAFAREPVAPERVGRVALDEWQAALEASRLPITWTAGTGERARLAIAAPLAAAASGQRELAEIWLVERCAAWQVREALQPVLPPSHHWVDAEDVWLGAPAIVGQVAAAEWRIVATGDGWSDADVRRLAKAAAALNAARSIPRMRVKGNSERHYDLRPLLADVEIERPDDGAASAGRPPVILARTRFDHELGAGRPDEVVAALADASRLPIAIRSMTRLGLILAGGAPRRDRR